MPKLEFLHVNLQGLKFDINEQFRIIQPLNDLSFRYHKDGNFRYDETIKTLIEDGVIMKCVACGDVLVQRTPNSKYDPICPECQEYVKQHED